MDYKQGVEAKTKEEADAWVAAAVQEMRSVHPELPEDELKKRLLSSLAYFAGYFGEETRTRVETLYGAEHPIFGSTVGKSDAQLNQESGFVSKPPVSAWPIHNELGKPWGNASGLMGIREKPNDEYLALAKKVIETGDAMLRLISDRDVSGAILLLASMRNLFLIFANLDGVPEELWECMEEVALIASEMEMSEARGHKEILELKKGT